jgi:membrane protein YqaA with SNARE-associated domain
MFAIDYAMGIINTLNLQGYYDQALEWFSVWGSAVILIAGFTIIPFKVFTIMAGAMKMNFFLFLITATLSRGARFYLVSYAAKIGGEKGMDAIVKNIDKIGYLIIIIFIVFLIMSY